MKATEKPKSLRLKIFVLTVGVALLSSCGGEVQSQQQPIKIDGSSTVAPITEAIAKH